MKKVLRSIDGGEGGRRKWLPKLNRERIEQLANVSVDFCQAVVVNPLERTVIIALDGPVHTRGETLDCGYNKNNNNNNVIHESVSYRLELMLWNCIEHWRNQISLCTNE